MADNTGDLAYFNNLWAYLPAKSSFLVNKKYVPKGHYLRPSVSDFFPSMSDTYVCCCTLHYLQAVEGAIGGNAYQHNKVNQWTSSVVEQCLNQLTKLSKPFKYIGKEEYK